MSEGWTLLAFQSKFGGALKLFILLKLKKLLKFYFFFFK